MISQINFLTPISGEQKQLHLSVLYDDVAPPACVLQTECNLGVMLYFGNIGRPEMPVSEDCSFR